MSLGKLLVEKKLVTAADLDAAHERMKLGGGALIDSLVELELVSEDAVAAFLQTCPEAPASADETGLDRGFLLEFVLKALLETRYETALALAEFTKLPPRVIGEVLDEARTKRLVQVLGLSEGRGGTYRYELSGEGRRLAVDALQKCQYIGPAPVSFASWQEQVLKQSISHDYATPEALHDALAHLVLPASTVDRLGPATNSGRAILLYGGVGNGKTSIAEAIGTAFRSDIWIPYCVEVAGQIIRVFDAAIHHAVEGEPEADERWVRCQRAVVVTGGELTLEMLDLSLDEISKTYEAPIHVKATGGVFIVDDFGRQRMRPQELLNRWILPLERRVDYLTLHTGMKIQCVFDQLVIFSTNFSPSELIDEAGLRRIPYKFEIAAPDRQSYVEILQRLCDARKLELPEAAVDYLLDRFYPETQVAVSASHPAFIVEHVIERCRFQDREPEMDLELVREAAQHLIVESKAPSPTS